MYMRVCVQGGGGGMEGCQLIGQHGGNTTMLPPPFIPTQPRPSVLAAAIHDSK